MHENIIHLMRNQEYNTEMAKIFFNIYVSKINSWIISSIDEVWGKYPL